MHWFSVATLFVALTLVGVEFSVSAFINPAAWRLEQGSQLKLLSRLALVLGRVMPVWYPLSTLLLLIQSWLFRHTPGHVLLLLAAGVWTLTSVASIIFLVPLNARVAQAHPDWHRISRTWDLRHRVRIAALAVSAILLTYVVVR